MSDHRDLPGLESVRQGREAGLLDYLMLVLFLIALSIIVVLVMDELSDPGLRIDSEMLILVAGSLVAAIVVWFYRWSPVFDTDWQTAPEGITAAHFLSERFIPWSEVHDARTKWVGLVMQRKHVLETSKGRVYLPIEHVHLGASAKQHLRRTGKGDGIALPDRADTLWAPIADDLPQEIEWTDVRPPQVSSVVIEIATALILLAAGLSWMHFFPRHPFLKVFVVFLVVTARTSAASRLLRTAKRVTLSHEQLEADRLMGKMTILWSCIRSTKWEGDWIVIEASRWKKVFIPWVQDDENARRLVLGIIRRLREEGRPVQLPLPETSSPDEIQS